jgi:Holliday junction DNA helicase RuvB
MSKEEIDENSLQSDDIVNSEDMVNSEARDDEHSLRPKALNDFQGQERILENLQISIEAAQGRGEPLDHHLFYGPPGLGKTTLANIISREMDVSLRLTSGPALERAGDLAAILTNLKENDILFIDEIHRLPRTVEEILYPAMEDFALDIIIGQGPAARSVSLKMPPFTLIGATTRFSLIGSPLRDRFGSVYRLDFYEPETLTRIVKRAAGLLEVNLPEDAAYEIAKRSRGTPRVANRILRRVRDFTQVRNHGLTDLEATKTAINLLDIDDIGLEEIDRRLLKMLCTDFSGGPTGLSTLSAAITEETDTVLEVYEPFLIKEGLIQRTPRGRVATEKAFKHLKITPAKHTSQITFADIEPADTKQHSNSEE